MNPMNLEAEHDKVVALRKYVDDCLHSNLGGDLLGEPWGDDTICRSVLTYVLKSLDAILLTDIRYLEPKRPGKVEAHESLCAGVVSILVGMFTTLTGTGVAVPEVF